MFRPGALGVGEAEQQTPTGKANVMKTRRQRLWRRWVRRVVAGATLACTVGIGIGAAAPAGAANRNSHSGYSWNGCVNTNWDAYYTDGQGGGWVAADQTHNSQFYYCD